MHNSSLTIFSEINHQDHVYVPLECRATLKFSKHYDSRLRCLFRHFGSSFAFGHNDSQVKAKMPSYSRKSLKDPTALSYHFGV